MADGQALPGQCRAAVRLDAAVRDWQRGAVNDKPSEFFHLDASGAARMVDVGHKPEQRRTAAAIGLINLIYNLARSEQIVRLKLRLSEP